MRILFVTSMPISYSGGLAATQIDALRSSGHNVDILTKYDWFSMGKNDIAIYHQSFSKKIKPIVLGHLKRFIPSRILQLKKHIFNRRGLNHKNQAINGILISSPDEANPPVKIKDLISNIKGTYDLIITLFLEHMLTIPSILAIYEKLECPVIIKAVDQTPMTGGCWFSLNCRRYEVKCGKCPGLNSTDSNDQTHKNYLIKKEAYEKMNYLLFVNSWMSNFAKASNLFDNRRINISYILIDEDKFTVQNKSKCRKSFGFNDSDIIFLSRYHTAKNKGLDLYMQALSIFYRNVDEIMRERILIVFVGTDEITMNYNYGFRVRCIPGIEISKLVELYNASSFFVSPSISDAGPSMVNQSIMCGTPVCCFNIGTALDVIEEGINGFKTEDISPEGLAECLIKTTKISEKEYESMRKKSRDIAMKFESKKSFVESTERAYLKLKNME